MPTPIEDLAFKDAFKHPKLFIVYLVFGGLGWLGDRLIPTAADKDAERWRHAYYKAEAKADSIQKSKDLLYEALLSEKFKNRQQQEAIKAIDSLVTPLGQKAKQIQKN